MRITKICTHRTKYMRWLLLSKGVYKEKRVRVNSLGNVVEKIVSEHYRDKHKNYYINPEDIDIINRAFELLEPIMEGVTNMPSLEIWRKLNE